MSLEEDGKQLSIPFTDAVSLRIFTVTWNMGNAAPIHDFHSIIPWEGKGYDLIVLGLQESTFKSHVGHEYIMSCIEETIGMRFKLIIHIIRAQMQLIIFCRKSLVEQVHHIEEGIENTGFLNIFPNKGGLCASLMVGHTSFAFLSCHLTAQEGPTNLGRRNHSVEDILGHIRAGDKRFDPVSQFHHCFLMGDLNYRLSFEHKPILLKYSSVKYKQELLHVLKLIDGEKWQELLKLDELNRELQAGRVLYGFIALQPNFPPTFKRIRGVGMERYFRRTQDYYLRISESHSRPVNESTVSPEASLSNIQLKERLDAISLRKIEAMKQFKTSLVDDSNLSSAQFQFACSHEDGDEDENREGEETKETFDNNGLPISQYYKRSRMPSYCDRILYKSLPRFSSDIQPLFFESCEDIPTSDHKPVRAAFDVRIKRGSEGIMVAESVVASMAPKVLSDRSKLMLKKASSSKGMKTDELFPDELRVEITNLRAHNLAYHKCHELLVTADPSHIIRQDAKHKTIRSSILYGTHSAYWKDEVLSFILCTVDMEGLANNAHLFISIWEHRDLIGVISISLDDILQSYLADQPYYEFHGPILHKGLNRGSLRGTIRIIPVSHVNETDSTGYVIRGKSSEQLRLKKDLNLKTLEGVTSPQSCCSLQ